MLSTPERTPVILPAHNEAEIIGDTLLQLDPKTCFPFVVVNNCNDDTDQAARDALRGWPEAQVVVNNDLNGKFPALQFAMTELDDRALPGVLVLDADSYPLFPTRWARAMRRAAPRDPETPHLVGGTIFRYGGDRSFARRMSASLRNEVRARNPRDPDPTLPEANLFIRPGRREVLEDICGQPHVYPSEGKALRDIILEHGGGYNRPPIKSPGAVVMMSERKHGGERGLGSQAAYQQRAPEGSISLSKWRSQRSEPQ